MLTRLENILMTSNLSDLFIVKSKDDNTNGPTPFVAYRVKPNDYRIRSFELWKVDDQYFFRIYHSKRIHDKLKETLTKIPGCKKSIKYFVDYQVGDYDELAKDIKNILENEEIIKECKASSTRARSSKFEGLDLPDVDTSHNNVIGQTFTWREIISIWEDDGEDNELKKALSQNGIYIQRSIDGKSRYIGSAYGSDGIIGRWMKHLDSNGDARHLNLFVLENGYNEIVFSVIEFYHDADIIQRENQWKQILGTINYGPYNGIQLNNN